MSKVREGTEREERGRGKRTDRGEDFSSASEPQPESIRTEPGVRAAGTPKAVLC